MASIDKIYGTKIEYNKFQKWINKNHPAWLIYFYPKPSKTMKYRFPMTNFPIDVERYLINNCPLDFVVERIKEQYGLIEWRDHDDYL